MSARIFLYIARNEQARIEYSSEDAWDRVINKRMYPNDLFAG